jgi:hypothetical protein
MRTPNHSDSVQPGQPGASLPESPNQPVRYNSGKGCLLFVVLGAVLLGIVVAAIVLFGQPA